MFPEAISNLREAARLTHDFPFVLSAYGEALAESGDRPGAKETLARLRERAKTVYVSAYDVGLIYAALGDKDQAFEWLATAQRERASFLPYITWDRRADSLRADPRFGDLLRQLDLPQAAAADF